VVDPRRNLTANNQPMESLIEGSNHLRRPAKIRTMAKFPIIDTGALL